jgi:branched-chain amino acid transport system substrate-binding protein
MRRLIALLVVAACAAGACGNSGGGTKASPTTASGAAPTTAATGDLDVHHAVDETGVTDDTIRVGSITSTTNPLGTNYGDLDKGLAAFFGMVNRDGGIFGRRIELVSRRDDLVGNNTTAAEALLAQDNVYAAFVAALLFTGAPKLAEAGIPTFGWNINAEWEGPKNFFPNLGAICFRCIGRFVSYAAQRLDLHTLGVLGYNVPQSYECSRGMRSSLPLYSERTGLDLAFYDESLAFGQADVSPQVEKMKRAGVDIVFTCMDFNGVNTVKKEMEKQRFHPVFLHPNLYDHEFVKRFAGSFEGDVVVPQFTAFEHRPLPPAIKQMFDEAERTGATVNELFTQGWIAAKQFYDALKATGPDFTRAALVEAWNSQPRAYTADGWLAPIQWPRQHESMATNPDAAPDLQCQNFVRVRDGAFVSVFGQPGKPWVCFDGKNQRSLDASYHSFVEPPY